MSASRVTLEDIYKVVNRLEDKMDARVSAIENRMDGFDAFKNRAIAIAGLFSLGASAIFTWIWERITKQTV